MYTYFYIYIYIYMYINDVDGPARGVALDVRQAQRLVYHPLPCPPFLHAERERARESERRRERERKSERERERERLGREREKTRKGEKVVDIRESFPHTKRECEIKREQARESEK